MSIFIKQLISTAIVLSLLFNCDIHAQRKNSRKGGNLFNQIQSLDLSSRQKTKLQDILSDFRYEMKKLSEKYTDIKTNSTNRTIFNEKREQLTEDYYEKALNILNSKQRLEIIDEASENAKIIGKDGGKQISSETLLLVKKLSEKGKKLSTLPPSKLDDFFNNSSALIDDQTFCRRVYLDLVGTIPSVEESLEFLGDKDSKKRVKLVNKLLDSEDFVTYQALRWGDVLRLKSEFPIKLWPNAVAVYHSWIKQAIRSEMPYNRFVYELLTASGSNFRNPPANFYRAVQENDGYSLAEAVTLTFMGDHLAHFSEKDQNSLKACFSNVAYKPTSEWKEEIVFWDREEPIADSVTMPDGKVLRLSRKSDPRKAFANWLTAKNNPYMSRALVNRMWFWLFGKALVGDPDSFSCEKDWKNSLTLNYLANHFASYNYDIKKLYRYIVLSRVYQSNAIYRIRPYDAEVLQDSLCQVFGTTVKFSSDTPEPFSFYPKTMKTIELADGSITNKFLQAFGRPSRDTGRESDRGSVVTESQRLFFINSTEINGWIDKSWILRALPLDTKNRTMSIQYMWLNTVARYPTTEELAKAKSVIAKAEDQREILQDLCWMLINSNEFAVRY